MNASATLINFIKQQEGFVNHAYLDPPKNTRGLYSIGYGHQIQPNEKPLLTKKLTEAEASLMLAADLRYYVNATNVALKRAVTQSQFDALVDLAYNAGVGAMQKVVTTWNTTGDSTKTVARLQLYRISNNAINPALVARRAHESTWFQGIVAEVAEVVQKKTST